MSRRLRPAELLEAWAESLTAPEVVYHLARLETYRRAYPPRARAALLREVARRLLRADRPERT